MKLRDYMEANPDFTFDLIPKLTNGAGSEYAIDVKDGNGTVVGTFFYDQEKEAIKEINKAIDVVGIDKVKRQLLMNAKELLQRAGINPEEIWRTSFFAIDDFMFKPGVSCRNAALLVKKIKEDACDVVDSLGKGMTNGLLFDWETVAETAVNDIVSQRRY